MGKKINIYSKEFRTYLHIATLVAVYGVLGLYISSMFGCSTSRPPEHYSELASRYCDYTIVTCSRPDGQVVYKDQVCRYQVNFGTLSVAVHPNDLPRNVLIMPEEYCTFEKLQG